MTPLTRRVVKVQCPKCHHYREAVKPEHLEHARDGLWHFVCLCGYRWAGFRDGAPIGSGGYS